MAGSLFSQSPMASSNELVASVEVVRQLARKKTTDRVAVMDRDFNVVYANEPIPADQPAAGLHPVKCYEAFAHRDQPCVTCPAIRLFDSSNVPTIPCSSQTACGMHSAFPLMGKEGDVAL